MKVMDKRILTALAFLVAFGWVQSAKAEEATPYDANGMLPGTTYLYCQAKKPDAKGCTYIIEARINDLEGLRIYCHEKPGAAGCENLPVAIKEDNKMLKGKLDPLGIFHTKRIAAYCDLTENVISSSTPIVNHCGEGRL